MKKQNLLKMLPALLAGFLLIMSGCKSDGPGITDVEHEDLGSQPWAFDIEELTLSNDDFRAARWTGDYMQMTVMSIKPGGEIGLEAHPDVDQFLRIEQGSARILMGKNKDELSFIREVSDDWAIFIPAGYWHNLINTGKEDVKLYSIYSPPEHPKGTVHATIEDDDHHH